MNNDEFLKLVQPVNQLIGYCQSASDITPDSNLKQWSERLIELADKLREAWDETALKESNDGKS